MAEPCSDEKSRFRGPLDQLSRKLRSFRLRLGCLSLRSALASICRIRSARHGELLAHFFERVVGVHADAEAHAQHSVPRAASATPARASSVSRRLLWIAASIGWIAFASGMKSPRLLSSSSPIGVSRLIGSLAIFSTLRTLSERHLQLFARAPRASARGRSRAASGGDVRTILLIVSIMCTGIRMVRAWSAIERVIACRIHHVGIGRELVAAAVLELVDRLHQADIAFLNEIKELQAAVRGISWRSRSPRRRLASTISFLAIAASRSPFCTLCTMRRYSAISRPVSVASVVISPRISTIVSTSRLANSAQPLPPRRRNRADPVLVELAAVMRLEEILALHAIALGQPQHAALERAPGAC